MAPLIDRRPSRWLATAFRAPAVFFRWRLGWLFRHRLLLLTHVGRRSGEARTTVLEVIASDDDPPTWFVAAAWGDRSDWYRNLDHHPSAEVMVGRHHYGVTAEVVDFEDAVEVHRRYVKEHPWAARMVGRVMGVDILAADPRELAQRIPIVGLTARGARSQVGAPGVRDRRQTQATYDRIAPVYGMLEGVWERAAGAAGLEALAPSSGESIVEIGCGPGDALVRVAGMVGPDGTATGVDIAINMCVRAQRRLRRASLASGTVVQADASRLPFAHDTFDAVYMSFTLELFDASTISEVLAECRRVIRPAGRLVVVALSCETPAPPMQRIYEWGHSHAASLLDCRPIEVERILTDAGFTVDAPRKMSLWGLPVAIVVGTN